MLDNFTDYIFRIDKSLCGHCFDYEFVSLDKKHGYETTRKKILSWYDMHLKTAT